MVRSFIAAAFLAWLSSAAVPQAVEFHRLTHNGRVLDYALILPNRFGRDDPARSNRHFGRTV
jgi:hypothetical protein